MITRVEHEAPTERTVITTAWYNTDKQRGYTILEFTPARQQTIKNPRDPSQEVHVSVPRTLTYRCMRCQFDCIDGEYKDGTGVDVIKRHVLGNDHPWKYGAFSTPYGNVADVSIEGIEDYSKEIK